MRDIPSGTRVCVVRPDLGEYPYWGICVGRAADGPAYGADEHGPRVKRFAVLFDDDGHSATYDVDMVIPDFGPPDPDPIAEDYRRRDLQVKAEYRWWTRTGQGQFQPKTIID